MTQKSPDRSQERALLVGHIVTVPAVETMQLVAGGQRRVDIDILAKPFKPTITTHKILHYHLLALQDSSIPRKHSLNTKTNLQQLDRYVF